MYSSRFFVTELLIMRKLVFALLILSLVGCGLSASLKTNPEATYGVTPVLEVDPALDPDETILDDVAEIANPALEELSEKAPANPADLTGWIVAAVAALGAAGTAISRKYLFKKKK
jgi:uncharacterized membrane protein YraQ (UPF0718 family)